MSNFTFLAEEFPEVFALAKEAERLLQSAQ
jgi:hypothetical protein